MFYGFLRVNHTPPLPPPPKKITTHIPKYSYILQNPMYYGSITLEFRIDSKPLLLPTKDLVFFRFIIFMYYPHIKTFNKIKTFSDLPYLIYPCNSKHIFFLGLIIVYGFLRRLTHASQNCQFQRNVATRT